jgi:FMN-dependent NADH-azoreductase
MSTILVITASPRGDRSNSRTLCTTFTELWAQRHPNDTILLRDIGHHPVPHVTEPWIAAAFTQDQAPEAKAAIAVSDVLVDELLSADRYVFAVPMHNFNIPSTFKAYIDHIVRPGKTFAVGPNGIEGLVKNKKALVITSSGGGYAPGSQTASLNFLHPYLSVIFGFIGLTDIQFVTMESMDRGEGAARLSREKAESTIKELAATW